jgi:superfamily II RNA helicase
MVKICQEPYNNTVDYQQYFDVFPYELSSFQKYAIEGIVEGHHVLVCAPTGSGKTLPAEFALNYFHEKGKKVIYLSPIKALTNQKYYEFGQKYPNISFGLLTGDIKTNPNADVVIMTTEIFMNALFVMDENKNANEMTFHININEIGCVVFDEVHYINDAERGQVWEKTILMLPQNIQMVMLSATIDNPQGFASWIENRYEADDKIVYLAYTNHRIVPLHHYGFLTTSEAIFKKIKDKDLQKQIKDNTNKLIDLQGPTGGFKEQGYRDIIRFRELFEKNQININRKHALNQLAHHLRDHDMLPAIVFVFSRKNVEIFASEITIPLLEDDSKVPYIVRRECEQVLRKLPNFKEYLELPEYVRLVGLLEKGIGIHHSGMIPVLREIVELMISKRYIKMLFATESFAIGLDCPIRTSVFTSLTKFDGSYDRYLLPHEYTQMAGRAGRRGIDTVGYVVHCNNIFSPPLLTDYKTILCGVPQKLTSKFRISYDLILNLVSNGSIKGPKFLTEMNTFSEKSMIQGELLKQIDAETNKITDLQNKISKKRESLSYLRTPIEKCQEYMDCQEKLFAYGLRPTANFQMPTILQTSNISRKGLVNKKKVQKQLESQISELKDAYKFLDQDVKSVQELLEMEKNLSKEQGELSNTKSWIHDQTEFICLTLINNGFICYTDENYSILELTQSGKIAANVAEIHPLIGSKIYPLLKNLEVKDIIGILSCFTDVKVSSELRTIAIPSDANIRVKDTLNLIEKECKDYEELETLAMANTGIHYNDILMYDLLDYSMQWCDCNSEIECKYFIQSVISEKGISVGDFTKAMMKIVTISKEFENIAEQLFDTEIAHKLHQIEGLILKYVLTSQSLYV